MIVFHLRNLDQNTLERAVARVQSSQTFNFWYDKQRIKVFFLKKGFMCEGIYK